MLRFKKSFKRKIVKDKIPYTIEQNAELQYISIRILHKDKRPKPIYYYSVINNHTSYNPSDMDLIKHLFDKANIERYVL